MNVLFVAQCSKRALTETRRTLDQFAERRGERTWQTSITLAGLDTVRRLLRKRARRNIAVACHWIRGLDHSELLWIVGDASQFNAQGAVPTDTTTRDVLRAQDENDWHSGEDIRLLAALAALLHDLGKASRDFQQRLHQPRQERNLYRHEWVSLRLFQAFVGGDDDQRWLRRLAAPSIEDNAAWIGRLQRDGLDGATDAPLAKLPPLAAALAWLVLTHHRLPMYPQKSKDCWLPWGSEISTSFQSSTFDRLLENIDASWNEVPERQDRARAAPYWEFDHGLPVLTPKWRARAAQLAQGLLERLARQPVAGWLQDAYVMHLARLGLMLADHHYSSLSAPADRLKGEPDYPLGANTVRRPDGSRTINQPLDEHLLGVEKHARSVVRALPGLAYALPALARHKGLRQRSKGEHFGWQNKAADAAAGLRTASQQHGFFGVNLASTGCGKTLANARIMDALAEPQRGLRCAIALGLRSLTLQTGNALRERLRLGEDELAIRVGGAASRELFEHYAKQAEQSGSESAQPLPEQEAFGDGGVLFEGNTDHPVLARLTRDSRIRALLAAPVLVCTVDHLVPATEAARGGHQIVPMLRLMSGDLVLDELDDFDLLDLPALTRLVHWAGLLGSRVLLSSATLPPHIVRGMFLAYRAGREIFQRHRGERPGAVPEVACAWFDEFETRTQRCAADADFEAAHLAFAQARHKRLSDTAGKARRLTRVVPFVPGPVKPRMALAALVREQIQALHADNHSRDPVSGKRVSFGLVRMANIGPLFDVALQLYALGMPEGWRVHLCVYHAQYPLLLRSAIEARLDATLNREQADAVFNLPELRSALDAHPEPDQIFVVLGSPVTEVGRDHDYDWALVEPSSMRSLIQLAGRVRRHRFEPYSAVNIALLGCNLRHFEHPGQPAYCRPGFESEAFKLHTHALDVLLDEEERRFLDARPRILAQPGFEARSLNRLSALEHVRLKDTMLPARARSLSAREQRLGASDSPPLNAASVWVEPLLHLTGVLSQRQPFRRSDRNEVELVWMPDEAGEDFVLQRLRDARELVTGPREGEVRVTIPASRIDLDATCGPRVAPWPRLDYLEQLASLAEARGLTLAECARRYGGLTLREYELDGLRYHSALGCAGAGQQGG